MDHSAEFESQIVGDEEEVNKSEEKKSQL